MAPSRKAWNEAMKSAGGVGPTVTGAGGRASGRQRKQSRSQRARKAMDHQFESSEDQVAYRAAVHIDALEETIGYEEEVHNSAGAGDDEEYFDEEEPSDDNARANKKRRGAATSSGSRRGAASSRKTSSAATEAAEREKRLRPRSLASILIEEAAHPDGVAFKYLAAEARLSRAPAGQNSKESGDKLGCYPSPKFCPVTGLIGIYTDPKTRIPYATLEALEQIRERPPPWMNLGGSAAYYEACKSLRNEE